MQLEKYFLLVGLWSSDLYICSEKIMTKDLPLTKHLDILMDKIKMSGQMIWIFLYTIGLDSCLGKLMVDLVGISRVSRDLPITKCLIPGVPDNLTLGHIPAWGRHLPSLAFSRTKSTFDTCNTANENPYFQLPSWDGMRSLLSDLTPSQHGTQSNLKSTVITTMQIIELIWSFELIGLIESNGLIERINQINQINQINRINQVLSDKLNQSD